MALGIALLRTVVPHRQLGAAIGWNALAVALSSAAGAGNQGGNTLGDQLALALRCTPPLRRAGTDSSQCITSH